jgi:hypothetical protein
MIVGSQAGNAPNDIAGLFFLLAVIAFLVNGAATARAAPQIAGGSPEANFDPDADEEHPQTGVIEDVPVAGDPRVLAGIGAGPLFIAGLSAGLGIGTKITLLAALGILTIGLAWLGGREGWWRVSCYWLGGMIVTAGFWYGRNLWFAANPFPQIDKIGPIDLPGPEQGGLYPREPHALREYYNDPGVWQDFFFPVLKERLGPLWPLILAAMVAGLVFALWKGGSRLMKVLAVTGLFAGLAYVFTPLTASGGLGQPTGFDANLRYVAPALIIGFAITPLIPALRHRPWPWVLIAGFGLLVLQGTIRPDGFGLQSSVSWNYGHLDESLELALLVVGIPALLVYGQRNGWSRYVLGGVAAAALALMVVLGNDQREQYIDDRYEATVAPGLDGGFRSTPDWLPVQSFGKLTRDARIGVIGRASAFGQYFFYGDDLSNHVQYLGKELNRGTFRQIDKCGELYDSVNAGDYDYIVVTPRLRAEDRLPPEAFWISADPAVKSNVQSGPARVFRVDGRLDPDKNCEEGNRRLRQHQAEVERLGEATESAVDAAKAVL